MKRITALITAIVCLCSILLSITAIAEAEVQIMYESQSSSVLETASGRDEEYVEDISAEWKFGGKEASDEAADVDFDDSEWDTVDIPHTWNIEDAEDGGSDYYRGMYWYRKTLDIDEIPEGKCIYIEFLGVNTTTDVYINGTYAALPDGTYCHRGGYTAFRYDITNYLTNGENIIAVMVDNSKDEAIAPISGDFNIYGGIYRKVNLITVDYVHIDLENYGSSGIFITTPNSRSLEEPEDFGSLNIKTDIVNGSLESKTITIEAQIIGDNAPSAITEEITIPTGETYTFNHDAKVENPHLWNGISYEKDADNSDVGYQYTVQINIYENDVLIDTAADKIGFRYFWVDEDSGFHLNGESHALRGVNRHQYKIGMGSALTTNEHDEDMELIKELGANAVRLCHYPQSDYFYNLCDENGIVVWTEIPFVNQLGTSEEFADVTKGQLTELIRQQYNRPSVCFWGLQNEVGNGKATNDYMNMKQLMNELDTLAKEEDTSGRYTVQAVNQNYSMNQNDDECYSDYSNNTGWKSDLISWNIYPGWYSNFSGTFSDVMTDKSAKDSRPMGISEYGWGANVNQHELYPELGSNNLTPYGSWHPEEYQSIQHEEAVKYINENDYLWSTFIWSMFDFSVDSRNEGSQSGLNDKGLVTNDRQIKKDSFYLYKANWNQTEPVLHITSSRMNPREESDTYIKVYSNCEEVELFLNGESLGMMDNTGNGIFITEDVELPVGENTVTVTAVFGGEEYSDSCDWIRNISSAARITSTVVSVDSSDMTVMLDGEFTLGELKESISGVNNAVWRVYDGDDEITDATTLITPGMEIRVTAEDGETTAVYTIISVNLAAGKSVTASSEENGNYAENAVDSDSTTRWVAENNTYLQSIVIDLGDEYILSTCEIDWYADKNRYYTYDIETSTDGINFEKTADRTENTEYGSARDDMKMKSGRYVRINVYGCSNSSGYAALYEVRLYGWKMESESYTIDYGNRLIIVPELGDEAGFTPEKFFEDLYISGTCTYELKVSTGYVNDGDKLLITNYDGKVLDYTVTLEETATEKRTNIALYKSAFASTEEGTATDGGDTHAYSAIDGDETTRWTADTNGGTEAKYPEWLGVDLGDAYRISDISLSFETKSGRIYTYSVYGSAEIPLENGSEDIPDGFELISDQSSNTESGGNYNIDCGNEEYRYIAVKVLDCDKWSDSTKYVAASIYELTVNGTNYTAQKPVSTETPVPSESPTSSETPSTVEPSTSIETSAPSVTPMATQSAEPPEMPSDTEEPTAWPTDTPLMTETPEPAKTPAATETSEPSDAPTGTSIPTEISNPSEASSEEIIYNEYDNTVVTVQSGVLIICNYDSSGRLVGIAINEATAGTAITPAIEITNMTRMYLWDSMESMKPLTAPWHK